VCLAFEVCEFFSLILPYAEQFVEVWLSVLQGTEVPSLSCVDKTGWFFKVPVVS